jgi:excisionase family DNA binding protein
MITDKRHSRHTIRHLQTHLSPYVTASDLARYWRVSLKCIYRLVDEGSLQAIRLGPRLLRIRTEDAIRFDLMAVMSPASDLRKRQSDR